MTTKNLTTRRNSETLCPTSPNPWGNKVRKSYIKRKGRKVIDHGVNQKGHHKCSMPDKLEVFIFYCSKAIAKVRVDNRQTNWQEKNSMYLISIYMHVSLLCHATETYIILPLDVKSTHPQLGQLQWGDTSIEAVTPPVIARLRRCRDECSYLEWSWKYREILLQDPYKCTYVSFKTNFSFCGNFL